MPPPAEKLANQVATAFSSAQRTTSAHPRATKLLLSAYAAAPKPFMSAFTHALNRILLVFSRDAAIERLVLFVSRFAATNTHRTQNLCASVLAYLLAHSNASGRAVRFRATQLIAGVLHHLPEEVELPDDVWAALQAGALSRSLDKVPRVRAAAAAALCRLQMTGDDEDPFCGRLVDMAVADGSAAVRKAALQAVAVTEYTLAYVAGRTRDVNVEVRKIAYDTLAKKVNPFDLLPEERVALLTRGLRDRAKAVREVCERALLLDGWLDGACQGNIFELVDLLGCADYEDDVLRGLRVVFESERMQGLIEAVEIDVNNMTHADVLLLRALSDSTKGDSAIEKFLPTTSLYAEVLRYYAVDDFASRHLLELCRSVDMSDEAGRKAVEQVIRADFLTSRQISEATVGSAARAMRRVMLEEEATSRLMLDIVQDILQPDEAEDEENTSLERADSNERYWREVRALNICLEVLRISKQGVSSASALNTICLNLVELAVLPQLMCEDEDKRRTAMECLGLYCLLDGSGAEARTKMPLFIQASRTDVQSIQELALKVIVDFLMVFDFTESRSLSSTENDSSVSTSPDTDESGPDSSPDQSEKGSFSSMAEACISILSQNITNADRMMRTIAVEGLARLLSVRRIAPRATLLSRLLIVHHNPSTEGDDLLRQCLSVFFPSFAMSSPQNRLGLEDAFRPTCRIIATAPPKSPLYTISIVQVAQFILHLTNPAIAVKRKRQPTEDSVGKSADQIHERLAEVILNEIIDACQGDDVALYRTYGKALSYFRFTWSKENEDQLVLLRKLAKAAMGETDDKRLGSVLTKFSNRIEQLLEDHEDVNTDHQDHEENNVKEDASQIEDMTNVHNEEPTESYSDVEKPCPSKQVVSVKSEVSTEITYEESDEENRDARNLQRAPPSKNLVGAKSRNTRYPCRSRRKRVDAIPLD